MAESVNFFCQLWDITLWCDSQTLILKNLLYTWKRIFILKKFFFFICQFVFHRVHDLFKEFIISYFVRVIRCDSTNAKWVFNHIRMIFQVINAFSNPVNDILSRCQSAIQIDNQQYKQRKWQMSWNKNWTRSLRSTEESTVNQNSFRGLSILYIKNFCETRKIRSNAIRVLFFSKFPEK